jgi:multiple sugar transport system ATP-binding protein
MNFFAAEVDAGALRLAAGTTVTLPAGRFDLRPGARVTLGIRPSGLKPAAEGLKLTVADVERLGGESYLYGAAPDGSRVSVHSPGQTPIEPGTEIALAVDTSDAHVFDADGRSLRRD